jgi:hypothetical protein
MTPALRKVKPEREKEERREKREERRERRERREGRGEKRGERREREREKYTFLSPLKRVVKFTGIWVRKMMCGCHTL